MVEQFEIRGKWFLPSKSRRRISGVLRYSPTEGNILELDGLLEDSRDFVYADIILGVSSQGEKVTLYRCQRGSVKFSSQASSSAFYAEISFLHAHLKTPESLRFRKYHVQYSNLSFWSGISGYDIDIIDNPKGVSIRYEEQQPIRLTEFQGGKIYLETLWSMHVPSSKYEAHIHQSSQICFEFDEDTTFDDCSSLARVFQNFLSLAAGSPIAQTTVTSKLGAHQKRKHHITKPVKIYFAPVFAYNPKDRVVMDMLFVFKDVQSNVQDLLDNWIRMGQELKPVHDLFFANFYRSSTYRENKFLNLTQAIETYHRRVYGGRYQDDDVFLSDLYISMAASIPYDLDKSFRDSLLKGKLRYANEYSLRKRIIDLLRHISVYLPEDFLPSSKEQTNFTEKVIDTRNYLTHYDETLKGRAAEGSAIYALEQMLNLILTTCMLISMGMESAQVQLIMSNSRIYRLVKELNRRENT